LPQTSDPSDSQIHLFTLVALNIGIGALLWLNLHNGKGWPFNVFRDDNMINDSPLFWDIFIGYTLLLILHYICESRFRNQKAGRK